MADDAASSKILEHALNIHSDVIALRIIVMFLLSRVAADRRTKSEADEWINQLKTDIASFLDDRLVSKEFHPELIAITRREIEMVLSSVSFD